MTIGKRVYVSSSWRNGLQQQGAGQRTLVLLDNPMSEPELMYLMTTRICVSLDEVINGLR